MSENDDVLSRIDAVLESAGEPGFDAGYWQEIEDQPASCLHCGHLIIKEASTSTGWTHEGDWQGVRCPGMLCGATPASR